MPLARTQTRIRTATPSSVREVNRSIVLELIRRQQPVSRAELSRLTGIFRSSVSDIVDELIAHNLVSEGRGAARRGRTPRSLTLNEDHIRVIGLNIRPEYCQIADAGLSGTLRHMIRFPTPSDPNHLVKSFATAVDRLEFEVDTRPHRGYKKVGIAVPGHVNVETGQISWIPTHPELAGFELARQIARVTGMETLADNDCNVGALSELWLKGTEDDLDRDFVFVNISDYGAGAGIVINGEPYRGHDSQFAAEFGHMIIDPHGIPCACGRKGCWERYVSNAATWERYAPGRPFAIESFQKLVDAAVRKESAAEEAFRELAGFLALGLSNIQLALNPSLIVVAGRISAVWSLLEGEMTQMAKPTAPPVCIRPARLSADDSLLHGAACLALRDIFARPHFG